jgi:ribonuclease E
MRSTSLGAVLICVSLAALDAAAQIATNCIPTKNQVVLRQRIAEVDAAEGRLDVVSLRAETQALHRQGMINDQQLAEFEKIIQTAQAPKGPAETPEGRQAAEAALAAKLQELNQGDRAIVPTADPQTEAKAREALDQKLRELEQPAPAAAPVETSPEVAARQAAARAALLAKLDEPQPAAQAAEPTEEELRRKAQQALAEKMAELDRTSRPVPPAAPPAPVAPAAAPITTVATPPPAPAVAPAAPADASEAARRALAEKMAELNRTTTPPAAPAVPAVATTPPPPPAAVVTAAPETSLPPSAEIRLAQEALAAKMAELNATAASPGEASVLQAPPASPATQMRAQEVLRVTARPPETPSALPPSTKTGWDRVEELTQLYRAGLMTPQEYHTERARIVSTLVQP